MNVFNFTGNLGKDIEIRYTSGAKPTPIGSFNVAVKSGYGQNESTTWVTCNLWGERAEKLEGYLTKGQQVAVSGELNNRKWVDKDGNERYSLEVRVNDLTLVGGKQANSEARQPAQSQPESNLPNDFDEDESSIPF
jgi:single-strand DNA-binding protein